MSKGKNMSEIESVDKKLKFSYSKLNTYEACPWRYKLQYVDKHFIDSSSIANEFGTLIHFIEETIANDIIANDNEPIFMIDENKYIDIFINAGTDNYPVQNVLGAKKLKEKYPIEFNEKDKYGFSYDDKANNYLNFGIYRLRDFLNANRNYRIVGVELPFTVDYSNFTFHGFIDRAFKDTTSGDLIIEDIKTWQNIKGHDLVTPLQFVIYTQAAIQLFNLQPEQISCFYELPLAEARYSAGTKGFLNRGVKKINKILNSIDTEDFCPKPSPLCHWCPFSATFPNQPEEGKNLCPYHSNWTRETKDFSVEFEWFGLENHENVLKAYIDKHSTESIEFAGVDSINLPALISTNSGETNRIRLVRRC